MTESKINEKTLLEKENTIRAMLDGIRALPLASLADFTADRRNQAAAESYLRRSLEALFDLGRHILAKGFGKGITEYKETALELMNRGLIGKTNAASMKILAGYRNRMVHFYNEISERELFDICTSQLSDIESVLMEINGWIKQNPEKINCAL